MLGVSKTATTTEIKKAYRKIAMKNHPDRNPGDSVAEQKFKEATEAYEVLSNTEKRAQYQKFGHNTNSGRGGFYGGFSSEGSGDAFGDIFGDMFGGRAKAGRSRGSDLQYNLEITLEEAVHGVTKNINIPVYKSCGDCNNTGAKNGKMSSCKYCGGSGAINRTQGFFTVRQSCPSCGGNGKIIAEKCGSCNGHGRISKNQSLKVELPAGVDHGDSIKHQGAGEASIKSGGESGDLYVQIIVQDHPIFHRDGLNLYCKLPVDIITAALGGAIEVPTISNIVKLKIPAETQTGKIFKLREKGIKAINSLEKGDLYCEIKVETPANLNKKQKELLENFAETLNKSHNPKQQSWVSKAKKFFEGKI